MDVCVEIISACHLLSYLSAWFKPGTHALTCSFYYLQSCIASFQLFLKSTNGIMSIILALNTVPFQLNPSYFVFCKTSLCFCHCAYVFFLFCANSVKLPLKCAFFAMLIIVIVVDRSFVMTFVHTHMLIPYVHVMFLCLFVYSY